MSDSDSLNEFFGSLRAAPRFSHRAVSIPGDFRTAWRLSVLCLLVHQGRAHTLALEHLHVLWWAIRSSDTRELLVRWFSGERKPDDLIVRFDPSLAVTLDLALGQGLVVRTPTGGVRLTAAGTGLVSAISSDHTVLTAEREFLAQLPRSLTQTQIRGLMEWR